MPPSRSRNDEETIVRVNDERTPLLAAVASAPIAEADNERAQTEPVAPGHEGVFEDEDAPLPRAQIFLLCYTRLVEPIAFFSIFPYINSMIEKTGGIDEKEVGFYSGLIESLFSATQMCVMIFWGKAADRFGRKPILAFSLFGVTIATALFGLSQSLWQMILFRCLAGVFAGTVVTVRAMLTENSTKKTQAKVFSWFAFVGNLGILVGPFIGGALERPAEKFKSSLGHVQFFHDYPYALPGFATAFIGLSAALLVTFFVKETLHIHRDKQKSDGPPMSTWDLLRHPDVPPVILIYNYVMLLAFAFTAVFPVFLYTSVENGGIGFSPTWIAATMGLGGGSQALWLLLVFPFLHKRIGTGGLLRGASYVWPIFFASDSICNLLLRRGLKVPFWIIFPINNIGGSGVSMAFTAVQLAINDIAPSHETFGTLNALVLAFQSGLRAIAPAASTSLYAIGVKYNIANGQLFWIILVIVAMGLRFTIFLLPEKAEGKPQRDRDENGQA